MRWFLVAAAATLGLVGGVLFVAGGGPHVTLPTPLPSASTSPSRSVDVGVEVRRTILEKSEWQLDFTASGLDARVNPEFDFDIASAVRFSDGRFDGGTGYGGGCDMFDGSYSLSGDALRLTFETLHQGCDRGSPQQIVERLVAVRRLGLTDCTGPLTRASQDPRTECATLTLFPDSGIGVLVYHLP
jgi:hypothetical protein